MLLHTVTKRTSNCLQQGHGVCRLPIGYHTKIKYTTDYQVLSVIAPVCVLKSTVQGIFLENTLYVLEIIADLSVSEHQNLICPPDRYFTSVSV